MTNNSKPISHLRQRMIEDMKVRRLSSKTQIGYIRAVKRFSDHLGHSPNRATAENLTTVAQCYCRLHKIRLFFSCSDQYTSMKEIRNQLTNLNDSVLVADNIPRSSASVTQNPIASPPSSAMASNYTTAVSYM